MRQRNAINIQITEDTESWNIKYTMPVSAVVIIFLGSDDCSICIGIHSH
jgi:hypothetical protein